MTELFRSAGSQAGLSKATAQSSSAEDGDGLRKRGRGERRGNVTGSEEERETRRCKGGQGDCSRTPGGVCCGASGRGRAGQASRAGEQGRRRAQDKGGNREYLQELIRFVVVVANPDDDVEELVCRLREKALSAGTVSFRGRAAEETQRER